MLENRFSLHFFFVVMMLMCSTACNRKAISKTTKPETDENKAVLKGDEAIGLPAPELIQTEETIALPEPAYLMLRLEKTACYGECPVFELKIYSDGRALWHGKHYCERIGYYEAFVPGNWREELIQEAAGIGFFNLLDHYPAEGPYLSDLPNTFIYVNDGGREKSISQNYLSPKTLIAYQERILNLTAALHWEMIKVEE